LVRGLDVESTEPRLVAWLTGSGFATATVGQKLAVLVALSEVRRVRKCDILQTFASSLPSALAPRVTVEGDEAEPPIFLSSTITVKKDAEQFLAAVDRFEVFGALVALFRSERFTVPEAVALLDDGRGGTQSQRIERAEKRARAAVRAGTHWTRLRDLVQEAKVKGKVGLPHVPVERASATVQPAGASEGSNDSNDSSARGRRGTSARRSGHDGSALDSEREARGVEAGEAASDSPQRGRRPPGRKPGQAKRAAGRRAAPCGAERSRSQTRRGRPAAVGAVKR
jgi:hypothetical protein